MQVGGREGFYESVHHAHDQLVWVTYKLGLIFAFLRELLAVSDSNFLQV